jgi:hypothetical protein
VHIEERSFVAKNAPLDDGQRRVVDDGKFWRQSRSTSRQVLVLRQGRLDDGEAEFMGGASAWAEGGRRKAEGGRRKAWELR